MIFNKIVRRIKTVLFIKFGFGRTVNLSLFVGSSTSMWTGGGTDQEKSDWDPCRSGLETTHRRDGRGPLGESPESVV